MKTIEVSDKLYSRTSRVAEAVGMSAEALFKEMAEEATEAMESQIKYLQMRAERARENPESWEKLERKLFGNLDDSGYVLDQKKLNKLAQQQEDNRRHNDKLRHEMKRGKLVKVM